MTTGTLKAWLTRKGFGFFACDGGGPDIFVHSSEVRKAGLAEADMLAGRRFRFDVVGAAPKPSAPSKVLRFPTRHRSACNLVLLEK